MHKFLFYNKFISCLYMFRALCAHHQEVKLYYTASGIITFCRPLTECDDTRCCIIQFWPPDDEHIVLETYRGILLTPWCRVLLEKLIGLQLVKKFPPFHGTRKFITALTSVRQLSLSWASRIQSIHPHPTSWRSILILSTHLRLETYNRLIIN